MTKIFKRFISVLLTLTLCFGSTLTVLATESQTILTNSQKASISDVLIGAEAQKDLLGLSATDFGELNIGAPVQTYTYINDTFEASWVMYPLIHKEQLVLWAIEDNDKFQISTALIKEVNDTIDSDEPFAIVYDRNSCYLYTNDSFTLLSSFTSEDTTRSLLNTDILTLNNDLEMVCLADNTALNYIPNKAARTASYYSCNVGNVSQNPPSYMCWAATIASIVNYCKGKSLTATSVAKEYYGNTGYNTGLMENFVPAVFSKYDLSYTYVPFASPSESRILGNIKADYPVYGSWEATNGTFHATGSGYSFVSGYSGYKYNLTSTICSIW